MTGMAEQVFLYFGDDFQTVNAAREQVNSLLPEADQAFGLEIIEARSDNSSEAIAAVGRCIEALQTVGLLGGRKIVWMRDANFLSDSQVGRAQAVKERLGDLVTLIREGLPPDQHLLITAVSVDKRYAFYKACDAAGLIKDFALPKKPHEIAKLAIAAAREAFKSAGLRADERVILAFADRVGLDSRQVANEVEKLSLAIGDGGGVSMQHIEMFTSSSREIPGWDLADAVGQRNAAKAIRILRQLLFQKRSTIGLVMGLESRTRELLVCREAMDRGWLSVSGDGRYVRCRWNQLPGEVEQAFDEKLSSDLRQVHPFRLGILAGQAANYSGDHLRMCLDAVLQAHEKLVSSTVPHAVILELLILRMTASG